MGSSEIFKKEHCPPQEAIAASTSPETPTTEDASTRYPKLTADQANHGEMNTCMQAIPSRVLDIEMQAKSHSQPKITKILVFGRAVSVML